jgi:S-formylglutathione hydrolase FrmB
MAYEDDLIKDVVGLIDRTFPVKAERSGRAIGGLSMGGYGAMKIGLKHHEMFGSVTAHSGAMGICRHDLNKSERESSWKDELFRVFSESPDGGPEDPFAIVEKIDHGRLPAIRFDCGKDDFLIEHNRAFHRHLDAMKIPHEYEEFPGSHNWPYWDEHVREAIAFHVRNLGLKK